MADSEPSTPLLTPNQPDNPAASRSRTGAAAITVLGGAKVLLGVVGVVAPCFLGKVFLLDIAPEAYIITRLFGSSVAAFGGSLLAADRILAKQRQLGQLGQLDDTGRTLLRAIVIANLMADSVDTISCTAALISGAIPASTFGMFGGGCILLAGLGAAGLRGV